MFGMYSSRDVIEFLISVGYVLADSPEEWLEDEGISLWDAFAEAHPWVSNFGSFDELQDAWHSFRDREDDQIWERGDVEDAVSMAVEAAFDEYSANLTPDEKYDILRDRA